jgi:hypothetical protein
MAEYWEQAAGRGEDTRATQREAAGLCEHSSVTAWPVPWHLAELPACRSRRPDRLFLLPPFLPSSGTEVRYRPNIRETCKCEMPASCACSTLLSNVIFTCYVFSSSAYFTFTFAGQFLWPKHGIVWF